MEGGVDLQSGYQKRGPELDIPLLQIEGVQFETALYEPMMTKPTFTEDPSTLPSNTELSCFGPAFIEPTHTKIPPPQAPLLLTMLHGWIYLLRSTLLALAWRSLLWLVICISTPLRIVWISIRLASLHYLSISNRGLSVLRIAWNIDMRR